MAHMVAVMERNITPTELAMQAALYGLTYTCIVGTKLNTE